MRELGFVVLIVGVNVAVEGSARVMFTIDERSGYGRETPRSLGRRGECPPWQ